MHRSEIALNGRRGFLLSIISVLLVLALVCWYFSHTIMSALQLLVLLWRHKRRDCVSNHQPHDCLFNRLFKRKSKKTSKLHVTGLCVGNSPGTGELPAQMVSNAENDSIWWRLHGWASVYMASRHVQPSWWRRQLCVHQECHNRWRLS